MNKHTLLMIRACKGDLSDKQFIIRMKNIYLRRCNLDKLLSHDLGHLISAWMARELEKFERVPLDIHMAQEESLGYFERVICVLRSYFRMMHANKLPDYIPPLKYRLWAREL